MSLESVFALSQAGYTRRYFIVKGGDGCILMFAAIIFAQTDIRKLILNLKNKKSNI